MNNHIIITSTQAETIRGNYGKYSAIEPIALPDGNYIIPERCLNDADLIDAKAKIQNANGKTEDIIDLPKVGEQIETGRIYKYSEGSENGYSGLVIAVQDHVRTIYPPEQTPALFTFYRENSDELEWIPNEKVENGWIRIYNDVQYEFIGATWALTIEGQTPDLVPALWQAVKSGASEWVQPTGGHDAYVIGDRVLFNGSTYESLIAANVWSPTVYPAGWQLIS